MNTNFKAISRLTDYEAARILANRDDAVKPYERIKVPELTYPKRSKLPPVTIYSLFREILP